MRAVESILICGFGVGDLGFALGKGVLNRAGITQLPYDTPILFDCTMKRYLSLAWHVAPDSLGAYIDQ